MSSRWYFAIGYGVGVATLACWILLIQQAPGYPRIVRTCGDVDPETGGALWERSWMPRADGMCYAKDAPRLDPRLMPP